MDATKLFPARWLKADALNGETTFTIKSIGVEAVGQNRDECPILAFEEVSQRLILNVTKVNTLRGMLGRETNDWIGRKVVLYPVATRNPKNGEEIQTIGIKKIAQDMQSVPDYSGMTKSIHNAVVVKEGRVTIDTSKLTPDALKIMNGWKSAYTEASAIAKPDDPILVENRHKWSETTAERVIVSTKKLREFIEKHQSGNTVEF